MPWKGSALIQLVLHREIAGAARRELVTDRLSVQDGDLLVWERQRIVFRCPAYVVAAITFAPHTILYTATVQQDVASANTRWSAADDGRLREYYAAGDPVAEIAKRLGRREGGVRTRLTKLGLRRLPEEERPSEGDRRPEEDRPGEEYRWPEEDGPAGRGRPHWDDGPSAQEGHQPESGGPWPPS